MSKKETPDGLLRRQFLGGAGALTLRGLGVTKLLAQPPANPDVGAVPCVLVAIYPMGLERNEGDSDSLKYTHRLLIDSSQDIRDGYSAGSISGNPPAAATALAPAPEVTDKTSAPPTSAPNAAASTPSKVASALPAAPPSAALDAELALLQDIHGALRTSDAPRALRLLDADQAVAVQVQPPEMRRRPQELPR